MQLSLAKKNGVKYSIPRNRRRYAPAVGMGAAVAAGLLAGQSQVHAYALTNTIIASTVAPYNATDTTGQNINYSGFQLAGFGSNSVPEGSFYTSIDGYVSGKFNTANGTMLSNGVTTGDQGGNAYTAFIYNANGFQLVGAYTTTSTGAYGQTNIRGVDPTGQVLGGQSRSSPTSTSTGVLGNEVWISSPTTATTSSSVFLGLFGPNNTYTKTYADANGFSNDTGTYSSQSASALSTGGYAVGTSQRYAGDGNAAIGQILTGSTAVTNATSLGGSSWIQTATGTPTEIGLFGAGNSYTLTTASGSATVGTYYSNSVSSVNANGVAFGSSSAYTNAAPTPSTSLGSDGFIYNGSTSFAVGMYSSGQSLSIPNYGGGTPIAFNYFYSPTTSVGTTNATSQGRSTSLQKINPSGVVIGTSNYYPTGQTTSSSRGSIAFATDGTTYTTLGYTANNFPSSAYPLPVGVQSFVNGGPSNVGQATSSVIAINAAGTIAGTSTTYVGAGTNATGASNNYTYTGSAAWSSTPAGVLTQIGLYNQGPTYMFAPAAGTANAGYSATYDVHQNPSSYGAYSDTPSLMNSSGLIAGSSQRYSSTGTSLGADAWVYDPANGGTTYAIDPTDESGIGYVFENIAYLSDNGVLVGEYKNSSSGNYQAFLWNDANPTTSFTLLNINNVAGLTTAGFQSLIEAYYGDDYANGPIYAVGSTGASASNTISALGTVVVPEPASLSILAMGALSLLGRKRRNA
jgi:hypothetical protein